MVSGWPRIILHADMDAFFAAVEQLDRPELRGRALLIGGTGPRGVVSTASYEARPYRVGSAMPMAVARRRCPHAIVLPPRFERYREISRVVMRTLGSFSPLVEPLSVDEAFVDMTGCETLFGEPREMGEAVRRAVLEATRLTVSVGVSTTKYVAKVASDHGKPDGLTVVPPGEVTGFLHPLAIDRLWGVGPRTRERLEAHGVGTIGDVAAASRDTLEGWLGGSLGAHLHALANGRDPREVVPEREAKSIGSENTLDTDIVGEAAIRPWLLRAADTVARRLRDEGVAARGVRVKLRTADFRLHTRQTLLASPTRGTRPVVEAAEALLHEFDLGVPVRLVGVAGFDLCEEDGEEQRQLDLFEAPSGAHDERLDRTVDALRKRFGDGALTRARHLDRDPRRGS
ncbi:MAG: DNA polymerase IV [Immundisolibacterales bacterium]|nr:DNA polymerase IV [Immundisolibacterales bacterium]